MEKISRSDCSHAAIAKAIGAWAAAIVVGTGFGCARANEQAAEDPVPIGLATVMSPEQGSWGATRTRGINVYGTCTDEDIAVLRRWGVNLIRYQITQPKLIQADGRWTLGDAAFSGIDRILEQSRRYGLRVVIDLHAASLFFPGEPWKESSIKEWTDIDNRKRLAEVWESIALRYRDDREVIAAYEILNEPAPPRFPEGYSALSEIMKETTAAIRRHDAWHTIVVSGPEYSGPKSIGLLTPTGDSNSVYTVHMYEPLPFSHQGIAWATGDTPVGQKYPGPIGLGWKNAKVEHYIDKAWLEACLRPVSDYQARHQVRIWIGEFSARRICPDNSALRWLDDVTDIFERNGWDWAYHCFRSDRYNNDTTFDLEYSSDPNETQRQVTTDRLELMIRHFNKNRPERMYPADFPVLDNDSISIDLSALNKGSAGKDGFVRVKDGHFATDLGRIRFVGVSIASGSCYPNKDEAEAIAEFLAKNGINLVRLHFFMWRLVNQTPEVAANYFDRLDFFVAALAKRGIYINLDLYDLFQVVDKRFATADEKYKGNDFFFNPQCILAAQDYASTIFNHVNPYLGRAYKDEPAIAFTELFNENSFFWSDGLINVAGISRQEAERLFMDWITSKHIDEKDWHQSLVDPALGLKPGNIAFASVHDSPVMKRFASHLTQRYYEIMVKYIRDLGVKIPVTGHNSPFLAADLLPLKNATDYTCTHFYSPCSDTSSLASPLNNFWLFPVQLARTRVAGMPCIVNEFSYSHPNQFRSEGIPELIAYASLQDIDAIVLFSFLDDWPKGMDKQGNRISGDWKQPPKRLQYHSNLSRDPAIAPLIPALAMAFRMGHVRPAINEFSFEQTEDMALSMRPRDRVYSSAERARIDKDSYIFRQALASSEDGYRQLPPLMRGYELTDVFQLLAWTSRISWAFAPDASNRIVHPLAKDGFEPGHYEIDYMPGNSSVLKQYEKLRIDAGLRGISLPEIEAESVVKSDTGEVRRDFLRGILRIETPQTLVMSGFVAGETSVGPLSIALTNRHASCILTSLDNLPLETSREVLLSFGMNACNRGQAPAGKDWMIGTPYNLGSPPILYEAPKGTVTWRRVGQIKAFREDPNTGTLTPIQATSDAAGVTIKLDETALRYRLRIE
jgi:aryl-phospho-beta-D-glucosidase BglC (GH1 family)